MRKETTYLAPTQVTVVPLPLLALTPHRAVVMTRPQTLALLQVRQPLLRLGQLDRQKVWD